MHVFVVCVCMFVCVCVCVSSYTIKKCNQVADSRFSFDKNKIRSFNWGVGGEWGCLFIIVVCMEIIIYTHRQQIKFM